MGTGVLVSHSHYHKGIVSDHHTAQSTGILSDVLSLVRSSLVLLVGLIFTPL